MTGPTIVSNTPREGNHTTLGGSPCPIYSNVFCDVLEYDPFFGTLLEVPSNVAREESGTEGHRQRGEAPSGGPSMEGFLNRGGFASILAVQEKPCAAGTIVTWKTAA